MLSDILPDLYAYKVEEEDFTSETAFSCKIRIALSEETEFEVWKKIFEENTNTSWIVRGTKAERRYAFNRAYVCHHSSKNKHKRPNSISRKNKNCDAALSVIIKRNTKYTRYYDKYVKEGLFGIIKINFNHSHEINAEEAWNWLKRSEDTVQAFMGYFNDGLTPVAARVYHEEIILKNNPENIVNSRVNPPKAWVYKLHDRWVKESHENLRNAIDFSSRVLREKAEAFKEMGCIVEVCAEPFIIVIITPLMQRQLLSLSSNISVFVDSSASCDTANSSLTLFLVATKAGAIPIGAAIHSSQSEESYERVFTIMNNLWNEIVCLDIENFITSDSEALRNGLRCVFPKTPLLLFTFHVLQSVYRWVSDIENGIQQEDKKTLINVFKSLMHASDDIELNKALDQISTNEICLSYPNFITYLEYYLNRRNEWCLADRIQFQDMQHDTDNYAETTLRILKDIVLNTLKAYSAIALLDYLVKVMDNYYSKLLLDIVYLKQNLLYDKCKNKAESILKKCEVKRFKDFFLVQSETDKSTYYEVDVGLCSCEAAIQGAFCKHQCAVLFKFELVFPKAPSLSVEERQRLFGIAVGTEVPLPNFLMT